MCVYHIALCKCDECFGHFPHKNAHVYKILHTLSVLHGVPSLKLIYESHDKTHTLQLGGERPTIGFIMGPNPTRQKTLEKLFSECYLARNQNHVILLRLLQPLRLSLTEFVGLGGPRDTAASELRQVGFHEAPLQNVMRLLEEQKAEAS